MPKTNKVESSWSYFKRIADAALIDDWRTVRSYFTAPAKARTSTRVRIQSAMKLVKKGAR